MTARSLLPAVFGRLFRHEKIAEDGIIAFLQEQIVRKDAVREALRQIAKAQRLEPTERIFAYIPLYASLEQFICANKLPVVNREFTKDELRRAVCAAVPVTTMSVYFQVLFRDSVQKALILFWIISHALRETYSKLLGSDRLADMFRRTTDGTPLDGVFAGMTLHSDAVSAQQDVEAILPVLQKLITMMYEEIRGGFGNQLADSLIASSVARIRNLYDYDTQLLCFDIVPEAYLQKERISMLSRKDLEEKIALATQKERDHAEKQARLAKELHDQLVLMD